MGTRSIWHRVTSRGGYSLRCISCAFFMLLPTACHAATNSVVLNPVSDAFTGNGQLYPDFKYLVVGGTDTAEFRIALEFHLPPIAGATLTGAKLALYDAASASAGGTQMDLYVHSYEGNGIADYTDVFIDNQVAGPLSLNFNSLPSFVEFDVLSAVQALYNSGAAYGGFSVRAVPHAFLWEPRSTRTDFGRPPTLSISYVVPEPSSITLVLGAAITHFVGSQFSRRLGLKLQRTPDKRVSIS